MPRDSSELTDNVLIQTVMDYIAKNEKDCEFLRVGQFAGDIKLLKEVAADGNKSCLAQLRQEQIRQLWKDLITDAVNVLKWHDDRERPRDTKLRYSEWLTETFGHVAFGIEELDSYFREFIEFERLLYSAEQYYRDHFLHVVRVWLIGMFIMTQDGHLAADRFRLDIPDTPGKGAPGFEFNIQERLAIWILTALCHDLGYPLQKISSINAPLRKMLSVVGKAQVNDFSYDFPRQHQFIDNFIMQFISSKLVCVRTPVKESHSQNVRYRFKTAIQPKYYLKFSKSFEELQHGILSCTLLMKRLVYFLESDFDASESTTLDVMDARQFLIRREILRAIAGHTCDDIYHITCDTLAFLLIICDELQQWDRPRFHEMRDRNVEQSQAILQRYDDRGVHSLSIVRANSDDFAVGFLDSMEVQIRKLFRRFHKILRSALDVRRRRFHFRWEIRLVCGNGNEIALLFHHTCSNASRVWIGGKKPPNWLYDDQKQLSQAYAAWKQTGVWSFEPPANR